MVRSNEGINNWEKMSAFRHVMLPESFEVDLTLVNKAFKRKNLKPNLEKKEYTGMDRETFLKRLTVLTEAEQAYSQRKSLSPLQYRLRVLMDKMLYDVLWEEKEHQELYGHHLKVSGLSLKELMLQYPEISEEVFRDWSESLGLEELYVGITPPYDMEGVETSSVYQRFVALLTILK